MQRFLHQRWFGFALGCAALACGFPARADIFTWTAPDGTINFTNAPTERHFRPLQKQLPEGYSEIIYNGKRQVSGKGAAKRAHLSAEQLRRQMARFQPHIDEAARLYRIPEELIRSIIFCESSWDVNAVSPKGAQGLMQLMPGTAQDLGVGDSLDPRENILGGTLYLRYLANLFNGDVVLMTAAYNAGHNLVLRINRVPDIPETREYVRRVVKLYRHFRAEKVAAAGKPPKTPRPREG